MTPNTYIDQGDHLEIILCNVKKEEVARTKIDCEDRELAMQHRWCLSKGYVMTKKNRSETYKLHTHLLGKKNGLEIDHINQNPLDNRRSNLRHVTSQQNSMNNKFSKGYCWEEERGKWMARIKLNGKDIFLGRFEKEEDAKEARLQGEIKYFGEYRCKNKTNN